MAELNTTLQQNLLTLLAYDDTHGKVVSSLVDPALFEGDLRILAERCITYWKKHGEAPKIHASDLVSDILDDPHHRKAASFRRILSSMIQLSESEINTDYVLDQLQTFTRLQRLKDAILRSAEELNAQQEGAISGVEKIWNDLLRVREENFEPGLRLTDIDHVLAYLQSQPIEFTTGIPQLDSRAFVPMRGTVMLILGATGKGKSWMMINLGKQALLQRKKVLHVTLEMSEEQTAARYYQSLFSVTKRSRDVEVTTLERDAMDRVDEIKTGIVHPNFTLSDNLIHDELTERLTWMGTKVANILIKRLPAMTIDMLRGYLDNLELLGFIPDMLILDYFGLIRTTGSDRRLSLGSAFVDFRNLLIDRHIAGVTAQQSSKEGARARSVNITNVAEDWSLTNTADMVITFSATDFESRYRLARLYVSKSRDEKDKFGVLLTQAYELGQFVLDSADLHADYFNLVDDLGDNFEDEANDGDE